MGRFVSVLREAELAGILHRGRVDVLFESQSTPAEGLGHLSIGDAHLKLDEDFTRHAGRTACSELNRARCLRPSRIDGSGCQSSREKGWSEE